MNKTSTPLFDLAAEIGSWRRSRGFRTPTSLATEEERDAMLGKLMLVVTEVSEAAEAVRHNDYENFEEELADTVIRLFDICEACGINIDDVIAKKMRVNHTRPLKHGKQTSL